MRPFTPLEPKSTEQLELEARQRRYIEDLLADFFQKEDDVLSLVALREIAWIMAETLEEGSTKS
jgi:hypothetical protein